MTTRRAIASIAPPRVRATLLVVLLVAVLAPAGVARAAGEGGDLTRWIGEERAAAGVHGLQVAGDLVDVATRHAQRMAAEGRLHHNPALTSEVSGWERVTENVGTGPDARRIHDALMASSSHRANILDTGVTQVGVGVAWKDGTLWVAQVFRLPSASAAPPPPGPGPSPAPQPPAPTPEPEAAPPAPTSPVASAPTSSATAPVHVSERAVTLVHDTVAAAPAPHVAVGTADVGTVAPAPTPVTVHVLTAARWLALLAVLGEE